MNKKNRESHRLLARCRDFGMRTLAPLALAALLAACGRSGPGVQAGDVEQYDLIIRNGIIYDGSGSDPVRGDVAIRGDRIAQIGEVDGGGRREIDANGLAVAPGFINMLSWANVSLIEDGRAQSDVRQGVTLEVMGEGESWGPWSEAVKAEAVRQQSDIRYDIAWDTLGQYLEHLEARGVSVNVASFVGAATVRETVIGFDDRAPTPHELARMQQLVREAMQEGAMGLGSSLIYAPGFYARTDELIALAKAAAEYDGMYISHMRSEGGKLLEAVDELLTIAREAGIRAEIYHLKAAGRTNWNKLEQVFGRVEAAREQGLQITANIYPYTAGATGLDAAMPPWVQAGGVEKWVERLRDPAIRRRVAAQMQQRSEDWENLYLAAGADQITLVAFRNPALKPLTGKTLAEIAKMRGTTPEQTAIDLVIEDGSRVGAVYVLMSEENVRKKIARPWVSLGSDAEAPAPEGAFLLSNPHPRTYGTFARFLGRYVRDEQVIPLAEAIRRLTSLPAANLRLRDRGALRTGAYADVVVFDPARIQDHATYDKPHVYATGVVHVLVNGVPVIADGEHTGARPGRVVRGPGWNRRTAM